MPPTNEPVAPVAAEPVAPATATPPTATPTATPTLPQLPEGYEAIRTEDKNNLISARDKANASSGNTEALVSALAQKDAIRDAMATQSFKDEYPDVTMDEILESDPSSPDEILEIAKNRQERYEKVKQKALKDMQVATAPTISQADKDTKLKELAKPAVTSRFQQALELQRTQVK